MPSYQMHRLPHPGGDPDPEIRVFFNDQAAMRYAMGAGFAGGCDVWQGTRHVGRIHAAAAPEAGASPQVPLPVAPT